MYNFIARLRLFRLTTLMAFFIPVMVPVNTFAEVPTEQAVLAVFEKIIDPVSMSSTQIYDNLANIEPNLSYYSNATQQRFYRLWCWYQYLDEWQDYVDYASKHLAIAEQNNDLSAMADLHLCRAYFKYMLYEYDEPLAEMAEALDLAERARDPRLIADVYATRGEVYSYFGEIAKSLFDYQRAAKNYDIANNEYYMSYVVTEIARALRRMGDFDGAMNYLDKQTVYFQSKNDFISEAYIAVDYGYLYLDKNELELAVQWFNRAIEIINRVLETHPLDPDDRADGAAYYSKAEALARMGMADEAEAALQKSFMITPEDTEIPMDPETSLVRAYIANARQNYALAVDLATFSVDQFVELENDRMLNYAWSELIVAYANLGEYKLAYNGTLELREVQERLKDDISEQYSQRLQTEYQLSQKERENQLLRFENKTNQLEIENNRRVKTLQTMVIVMAFILFLIMIRKIILNIKQTKKLQSLAMSDPLTGLSNRRAIESFAESVYLKTINEPRSVSMISFDIDNFKTVNDTYGHDVGDLVIKHVAELSKKCLRESDMLSRYGGEEYLAILPGTSLERATIIAERVCQSVADGSLNHIKAGLMVTISIGVAEKLPDEHNPSSTIRRADIALYDAKNSGRNQVKVAPSNDTAIFNDEKL